MSTVYNLYSEVEKEDLIDQLGRREILDLTKYVSGEAFIDGKQSLEEHKEVQDKILELADRIYE